MIRVGILGMGVMGRRRAAAVELHPALELVGVSDDAEASREVLAQNLDLVFVCVPNSAAAGLCRDALESGRHVFCEKPPARSLAELLPVVDAAEQAGRQLMFGFNHRLHGSVQRLLQWKESGELGALHALRGVYGKPGNQGWRLDPAIAGRGILLDQGIHMLDLMLQLDDGLEPVAAVVEGAPVEVEVQALLRSKRGVVASLHSSAREPRCIFRLEAVFEGGRVTLDGILSGSMAYAPERAILDRPAQAALVEQFDRDSSWADEVARMASAVLDASPVTHGTAAEAVRVMGCIERIYEVGSA